MNTQKSIFFAFLLLAMTIAALPAVSTAQGLDVKAGADLVSRYLWRGIVMNDAPNVQPYITLETDGFAFGFWGSATLANNNAPDDYYAISQETDFWAGYTHSFDSGAEIGIMVTDYYFPKAGLKFSNFNNYDDADGPGAHTLEAGISLKGPSSFPLTCSVYRNIHNDAGNNMYIQLDYSLQVKEIGLDMFIGSAAGSDDNPAYYGTDEFSIICLGLKASRSIKITADFTLPLFVSYTVNPNDDAAYVIFGCSL